jgi:hypothetical protein
MAKYTLRTPTGRRSIPTGTKEHTDSLPTPGLKLAYRKSKTLGGVWFAHKHKEGTTRHLSHRIGAADDTSEANNATFFSFEQAAQKALEWFQQQTGVVPINKHYTVRNLMEDYLAERQLKKRRSQHKAKRRIEIHILSVFGDLPVHKLTHQDVENWFHKLAEAKPRKRTRLDKPAYQDVADPENEEYMRQRQATANRIFNIFRAMLNYGYQQHKVSNRAAWDKIKSFNAVNEPKVVEITFDQLTAVIAACEPVLQPLAKAALYCGCGGPGCSDSFLRFLSGSPCFLFGRRVVLAGG